MYTLKNQNNLYFTVSVKLTFDGSVKQGAAELCQTRLKKTKKRTRRRKENKIECNEKRTVRKKKTENQEYDKRKVLKGKN